MFSKSRREEFWKWPVVECVSRTRISTSCPTCDTPMQSGGTQAEPRLPVNFRGCWGQPHSRARAPWSRIRRCMSHLVASGTKRGLSHLTTSLQYIHACSCPNSLIHQQFLERANCCIALAGRVTKHSHTLLGVQCTSTSHCKAMLPGHLW